ncbi:DUF1236 domain-containing protein [Ensifer sp. 4252]|uniref:DUF1236 domain-containing protein n=1 Tax=Ensifer sp. 4252 TaxID=3373915 RepID=UPI003D1D80CF
MKNLSSTLLRTAAAAGFVLVTGTSAAFAAMTATTVTDLNVRAGPGPQYPTVGLAIRGSTAVLDGCIEGSKWCRIDVNGLRGWVYAQYLTTDFGGAAVVVQDRRADLAVPVVTYEAQAGDPPLPAPGDELLGPVEEVEPIVPPDTVRTYITTNPGETIYLDGEVVVGAELPQTVEVRRVPDYSYDYVSINGQPVLVEPTTRRIVYVYR